MKSHVGERDDWFDRVDTFENHLDVSESEIVSRQTISNQRVLTGRIEYPWLFEARYRTTPPQVLGVLELHHHIPLCTRT